MVDLRKHIILIVAAALVSISAAAQDTIHCLDEVKISSQKAPSTIITSAPTQVVDATKIEEKGAIQLSDALRDMAGITLKDYGGVGGLKTVSARGLGSQFSTLTIDGIAVDNSQNGQVDLGRYLVGNAAYVGMSQGQGQQSLLSARAYASGSVISLESAEPTFFLAEKTNLRIGMDLGSFGMLSPSFLWEQRWNKKLRSSLWANYLKSDGNYPFTVYYTANHQDSSHQATREHSAMYMFTADGSLFYHIATGNNLTFKLHYMRGMHQLPGHVILYITYPSRQSTNEEAMFVQGRWRIDKETWKLQLLTKLQRNYDKYEDSAANTLTGYLMNDYRQNEGYLSVSTEWSAVEWLNLWIAVDGDITHLKSNLAQRNDVLRQNAIAAIGLTAHYKMFELRANLLGNAITDHVADLANKPTYSRLSPYVALMVNLKNGLTLRYFYKETFRAPNFSELYFFNSLPRNLYPEKAHQHNIGLTYLSGNFSATLDGYYNLVDDKIIALPSSNMFYWSMMNLGKVEILGVDFTADYNLHPFVFHVNYSFAHAVDKSDPNSKIYGHQIRYTPRHSGGGSIRWESKCVNIGASAMVVGHRYTYAQNTDDSRLPAYCDIGLSADHTFNLRLGTMKTQIQVFNLFDAQYEVVQYYPMMGRNLRLKIEYNF